MVMTDFYRLLMAVEETENAWYLGNIVDTNDQEVTQVIDGQRIDLNQTGNLRVELLEPIGGPVDFRLTYRGIPIISTELGDVVDEFDKTAIQRVPLTIGTYTEGFEMLKVLKRVNCLDFEKSEYSFDPNPSSDGKTQKIRAVPVIKIQPEKVYKHSIFLLGEWPFAIIVSSKLKEALEIRKLTGFKFVPV